MASAIMTSLQKLFRYILKYDESSITHHNTEEVMAVRYHVQCTTTLAAAKMKIDLFLVLLLLLIDDE